MNNIRIARGGGGLLGVLFILALLGPTMREVMAVLEDLAVYVVGAAVLYVVVRIILARIDRDK